MVVAAETNHEVEVEDRLQTLLQAVLNRRAGRLGLVDHDERGRGVRVPLAVQADPFDVVKGCACKLCEDFGEVIHLPAQVGVRQYHSGDVHV